MGRGLRALRLRDLRFLPRIAVVGIVALVLLDAPAGAAVGPTGATGPTGPTDPTTSSTSTTSTTTTTTPPDASNPSQAPDTGAPDPSAGAGPPELAKRGVALPGDSLVAAIEELSLERARVDILVQRRTGLEHSIQSNDGKLTDLRAARKREQAQRLARAVATYRGDSSGWRLGVLTDHQLDDERAVYLVAAVDASARKKIKSLDRAATRAGLQIRDERENLTDTDGQLNDAVSRVDRLVAKLAESSGAITILNGERVYVPTGPSKIATLADTADTELSRLLLSQQPPAADAAWLAARDALALELARMTDSGSRDGIARAMDADWDGTAPNVLHVMLFALRQVGKAYIYATAGPDTFDCSGLTKAAYAQIGLGLPHFSGAQLRVGIPVPPESLRPGDLLAYGPDGSEHITMYIGGGLTVAAKGRAYGVVVGPVRLDPTKGFAGATRVVP